MGISDDIIPKYRHSDHSNRKPEHWHNDPHIEDQETDPSFDDDQKQKHVLLENDDSSSSDDFFSKQEKGNIPEKNKDGKATRRVSGWIVAILLVCLFGYIIVTNYQKIRTLLFGSVGTTNSQSNQVANDQTQGTTTEIQSQDYTTPTQSSATPADTSAVASSQANIDKKSFKIQLLNGNGIANSAASIKKTLEASGFVISSTGNAKNFNYIKTYVYFKTGKDQGAELIKAALKDRDVISENSDTIAKTYDIVIVIGKQ